jgi:dihydrodipicolinate synthase/N-acetylneuraminate lyase
MMPTTTAQRPLRGIHVPTITIFRDTPEQEIDIEANKKHILYLAQAGVQGVLIQGSTAEQVALTREERIQVSSLSSREHDLHLMSEPTIAYASHSSSRAREWV